MKNIFSLVFLFLLGAANAQDFEDARLQSLVDAEKSFARMAKEKNTRDAFLSFLADDAITSGPSQGPRTGKKHLEQQPANESWLYWYPVYTDIASSGDFGFNTGPWEFRQKRTDEKPVAFGQFVSVWKKNVHGEWKVAIDIGISHGPATGSSPLTTSSIPLKPNEPGRSGKENILATERNFIAELTTDRKQAYSKALSSEARFFRPGSEPILSKEKQRELIASSDTNLSYTVIGGDVASSGDLAFVYGTASTMITKDGSLQAHVSSYMRFWKKEDGKNWKIVVDLISN